MGRTERILSHLPRTFRALPPPTALHALAAAVGGELQRAENALADVMQAHWVDHADRGAAAVDDLECLAALYGLSPRPAPLPEETVEEFRARLKSHVRTFLEGTSTLGGVLRVAADALGLRLEDRLDGWWNRAGGDPVLVRPRGDDAAALLFGVPLALARGRAAAPARVEGPVLPLEGADLRGGSLLRLAVDGGGMRDVECAPPGTDRARVPLHAVLAAVNAAFGREIASDDDGRLVLRSPTAGDGSSLEIGEVRGDAAPVLLGLPARERWGTPGRDAVVAGAIDLPDVLDLRARRYLRLAVDGQRVAEVDCAGGDPAATPREHVAEAVNAALGPGVAAVEGARLVLRSPTPGAGGSLVVREPAAQDAAPLLLGDAPRESRGSDPGPAELVGAAVLPAEIDLSAVFAVRLRVDGRRPVTVDCAGADPGRTGPAEVAARLAAAVAPGTASFDGAVLRVASATAGAESTLAILPVTPEEDAGPRLFGLRPRRFRGAAAAPAVVHGTPDLAAGVDVRAHSHVAIALDGAPPLEVDLAGAVARMERGHPEKATAAHLAQAINAAFGQAAGEWPAQDESGRLVLASATRGTAAAVELVPLEVREQRPFVTRAFVAAEAASVLLGAPTADARGRAATRAVLAGTRDLRRGVDLREARWLRLSIDGSPAVEVDCADGVRLARAVLPAEAAAALNAAFHVEGEADVATVHAGRLVLTSRREGAAAAVRLEPPRARDARPLLLGLEPGLHRGHDGRRVAFAGTADLAEGVELSADDRLRLKVDGVEREVRFLAEGPARMALPELVAAVNTAFGRLVARGDGAHLVISAAGPPVSGDGGDEGTVEILPAQSGADAAPALLGIVPPRAYRGEPPEPAAVAGAVLLSTALDLRGRRFLRLSVDGAPPVDVDCAAAVAEDAAGAVPPPRVAEAVERALPTVAAEVDADGRLVLATRAKGSTARIELLPFTGPDARAALFGDDAPDEARGEPPAPAEVAGTVDLSGGADLSASRTLRIALDGGRWQDVDVGGLVPGRTEPPEVVAGVEKTLPGVASLTPAGRLRLVSTTAGSGSRVEVLPVRMLEVVEYPAATVSFLPCPLRHGGGARMENDGAHGSPARVEIHAPQGASGPALADAAAGTRIRYLGALGAGETLRLERDPSAGVRARVIDAAGIPHPVPPWRLLAGSAADQAQVPFGDRFGEPPGDGDPRLARPRARRLTRARPGQPAALRLDDPWQPRVVVLRERTPAGPRGLCVLVTEAVPGERPAPVPGEDGTVCLPGRVRTEEGRPLLVDRDGSPLAVLLPGTSGGAERHEGRMVMAEGALHPAPGDGPPVLVARRIDRLYDVTVREQALGRGRCERFASVSIGSGAAGESLVRRVAAGSAPARLVMAAEEAKDALLHLPRGEVRWTYTECHGARLDQAALARARDGGVLRTRFPGAGCVEMGILDVSRLVRRGSDPGAALVAGGPGAAPEVELRVEWTRHRPGSFELRLPARLPEHLGAALDAARLGAAEQPRKPGAAGAALAPAEVFPGVVSEPAGDPDDLVARLSAAGLVSVTRKERAPIGWTPVPIPFRRPRVHRLSRGRDDRPARLYLADPDVPGVVFELTAKALPPADAAGRRIELSPEEQEARAKGAWGNAIEVGVAPFVPQGADPGDPPVPGRFTVTVAFAAARVESAREAARGGEFVPSGAAAPDADEPCRCATVPHGPPGAPAAGGGRTPVGVLHAKAAGVAVRVIRERAGEAGADDHEQEGSR
ncbi:MAG TPA: hypothetical protein VEX86_13545 [Longimicrobium sp.]|nr:hypothetical protein [Longimicrobium sp.]